MLERHKADVEMLIMRVHGFVFQLIRTPEGGISVTVCQDKEGTDESIRVAADWIRTNAGIAGLEAPHVHEGDVILSL